MANKTGKEELQNQVENITKNSGVQQCFQKMHPLSGREVPNMPLQRQRQTPK